MISLIIIACGKKETFNENQLNHHVLIEVDELKHIYDQPNIKIIDFRKKEEYLNGHIEGALHIWRTDIENPSFPYNGVMADKSQIELLFSELGINNNDTLIVYDDIGLCDASRLWWLLQNYDFENVKLLHGGLNGWIKQNGVVSKDVPKNDKSNFKLAENSSMKYYVSKDDVLNNLNNSTRLLDTRTPDEFFAIRQKNGAHKAGRLPNSINIDWAHAINYNTDKRLKSIDSLEYVFKNLNVPKDHPIIVYCHSGVRSAHTTFVLTQLLGYNNVKNYDGSWTEWSYFDELPIVQDSLTQIRK